MTSLNSVDVRPMQIALGTPFGILSTYAAALPSGIATQVATAPSAWTHASFLVCLTKVSLGLRRFSRVEADRDLSNVVTWTESEVILAPPPGSLYDVTVAAGGGAGGIALLITPASVGWSVAGIRRQNP